MKCLQQPVPASSPMKTKVVKVTAKVNGKLVKGFSITTETPEMIRRQDIASFSNETVPLVIEKYALTQAEAKKKADEIARKHNTEVYVLPARILVSLRK